MAPIVSIFSEIFETTGATGTTRTGLRFPYNRLDRLKRCLVVEVLNLTTIFWRENHFHFLSITSISVIQFQLAQKKAKKQAKEQSN